MRYSTRPPKAKAVPRCDWYSDDDPLIPNLTVDDHEAVWTGLLDDRGDKIYRSPNPVGFGRDKEW